MGSLLNDSSSRDDTNHIGVADGGESTKEGGNEEEEGCECTVLFVICPVEQTQIMSSFRMIQDMREKQKEGRREGGKEERRRLRRK